MWFEVDKAGLAAVLERRGKAYALFELISNSWDSGARNVFVTLEPVSGSPFATLQVEDDSPEGWLDLDDAYTMFRGSRRGQDPQKRGRFSLGEKLVLAICRDARIVTTSGSIVFDARGRHRSSECREVGTLFVGTLRMTRDELAQLEDASGKLIPPTNTNTIFNGTKLHGPKPIKTFDAKLPTEIADADGNLRRTVRTTSVMAYESPDGVGDVLEMGIPICTVDWPWRLNVQQKVPLGMDRDSVTVAFRKALQAAAVNALADTIDAEESRQPWMSEAIGDPRVSREALAKIVTKRFGERAVVAVPGDPMANANAEAAGCTVIHGGALTADAWANLRKHAIVPSSSQTFPTPRPSDTVENLPELCPLCKRPVK